MEQNILTVIISAGLASFISISFQFITKIIDIYIANKESKAQRESLYKDKKEEVYIAALNRLIQIKQGFDFSAEDLSHNRILKEVLDKHNQEFATLSPKLRLYAPDHIFKMYHDLSLYAHYAYTSSSSCKLPALYKNAFDSSITVLAHFMQEDIGYRKYNNSPDTILCPKCQISHDIVKCCPKCGMTYDEFIQKGIQDLKENLNTHPNNNSEVSNTND